MTDPNASPPTPGFASPAPDAPPTPEGTGPFAVQQPGPLTPTSPASFDDTRPYDEKSSPTMHEFTAMKSTVEELGEKVAALERRFGRA